MGGFNEMSDVPAELPETPVEATPETPIETGESLAEQTEISAPPVEIDSSPWIEDETGIGVDENLEAQYQEVQQAEGDWWEQGGEVTQEFNAAAAEDMEAVAQEAGGGAVTAPSEAFNEAAALESPGKVEGSEGLDVSASAPAEGLTETFNAAAEPPAESDPPPEQNHERQDWLPPPSLRGPMP